MIRYLTPWRAIQPGDLTLLRSPGRRLTKVVGTDGIRGYDKSSLFSADALRLDGVDDLAVLLAQLAGDPHVCIIRGVLRREFGGQSYVVRRCRGRDGALAPFAPAARSWIMVDMDGIPRPSGVDPVDPIVAGGALRRELSAPFQTARAVVQLSSTAGPGLDPNRVAARVKGAVQLSSFDRDLAEVDEAMRWAWDHSAVILRSLERDHRT